MSWVGLVIGREEELIKEHSPRVAATRLDQEALNKERVLELKQVVKLPFYAAVL